MIILTLMKIVKNCPKEKKKLWEKGEIVRQEQFFLFPHCFKKICTPDMWKQAFVWERVKFNIFRDCKQNMAQNDKVCVWRGRYLWLENERVVHQDFPTIFSKPFVFRILTLYQTTNFRLIQTERVCRRQFQIWRKWKKVIQTGRKHCGKRRFSFSHSVSKGLFPRGVKRCYCVGMG